MANHQELGDLRRTKVEMKFSQRYLVLLLLETGKIGKEHSVVAWALRLELVYVIAHVLGALWKLNGQSPRNVVPIQVLSLMNSGQVVVRSHDASPIQIQASKFHD